jgi:AraC-like DNA-binding protein
MAKDFPAGHHIVPHSHERAQLIFAAHGAMLIATREGSWAVPPQRAVWMPGGVTHEIRMAGDVAMRTLYVRGDAAARLAPTVRVLAVSPLLRELILRACALPLSYDEAGPAGRLMTLILDEIAALPTVALDLPLPRDARLGRICRALSAEPGATRTLSDWGREAGASPRTLARLFVKETGLTFAAWRQQARLLAATAMLGAGEPITRIALDLGYESPSAFTAMFKRALGAPPSHYFGSGVAALRSAAGGSVSANPRRGPSDRSHRGAPEGQRAAVKTLLVRRAQAGHPRADQAIVLRMTGAFAVDHRDSDGTTRFRAAPLRARRRVRMPCPMPGCIVDLRSLIGSSRNRVGKLTG